MTNSFRKIYKKILNKASHNLMIKYKFNSKFNHSKAKLFKTM